MPLPSKRQRGTLRSCSSGRGLRRRAMHWAPASNAFTHSLTEAMPEPNDHVAATPDVALRLVGLNDALAQLRVLRASP